MTPSAAAPKLCDDCGTALDRGQRYCLGCGARVRSRDPQLVELLRRGRAQRAPEASIGWSESPGPPGSGGRPGSAAPADPRSSARPGPSLFALGLTLPSPRVSALLVLVFLGFGVILGGAAGSRARDTFAASARSRLRVVIPRAAPPAPQTSPSAESTSEPPPLAESTPTPGPAAPAAPASTSGSSGLGTTPSPSSSGSSGSTGSEGGLSRAKGGESTPGAAATRLPPIKHVFVVALSDQPYAGVFGPSSTAPYLSHTLERQGELLVRYYAVAHEELANGAALVSGQGPTADTAANCPTYTDVVPATPAAEEQVIGNGCVYPPATQTLAGQLSEKHLTWRAYVEGMDEAAGQAPACGHPALGQTDPTAPQAPAAAVTPAGAAAPSEQAYATSRNPFVYFHSVIDTPACAADDVGLNRLSPDLASARQTPSFSYIVPDRCHDGNPTPCAAGQAAGLPAADGFLKKVVPQILGSKAYKQDGLLVITVDEAPSSGEFGDSSSCCGQPRFPNMVASGGGSGAGPTRGGGEVGALMLSPFVKPATTSQEPYNHFSLLRTIEDLFALKHLGYAASPGVSALEPSLFQASKAG